MEFDPENVLEELEDRGKSKSFEISYPIKEYVKIVLNGTKR